MTMKIKCAISINVPYEDKDGILRMQTLVPGEHVYPMLNVNDKVLANELFTLRKIHRVSFNERLPQDLEILKGCPKDVEPVEFLAGKVLMKPSPKGRHVNKKSEERKKKEAALARDKKKNAPGPGTENSPVGGAPAETGSGKIPRKVSNKG